MKEHNVKYEHSLPPTRATILKYCAVIGSSQLFAFMMFHFVSKVNEAEDFLVSILEISSLTILFGLFLKSGILPAMAIAFLLITAAVFTTVGIRTRTYNLSMFSALSSMSLGVMLYSPTVSRIVLLDTYPILQVPVVVPILFAAPLASLVLHRLIRKSN